MKFNVNNVTLATKFADAMIAIVENDKDILEKFPEDMDEFFDTVKGIFGLKLAKIFVQMDEVQEGAKEDEELSGILELLKVLGGN